MNAFSHKNARKSLKCTVLSYSSKEELFSFYGADTEPKDYSWDYVGAAIASTTQTRAVQTEEKLPINPKDLVRYRLRVEDPDGIAEEYVISSVSVTKRRAAGTNFIAPKAYTTLRLV